MTQTSTRDWWPLAAVAFVGGLYVATAARWLTHADSPEFAALFELGGAAHPPGYPTVVLFYQAFSWIPLEAKLGASVVTVLVGTGAVALTYRAARAWGASRRGALIAMLLVGLNSQVWLVHTHPEAFAFNNLFAAAIVWLSAPDGPLRGARRVAALGLAAGLALGAHHSIVFLAPLGVWGVVRGSREAKNRVAAMLAGAGTLTAGLAVYGYLVVAPEATSFGHIDDFGAVLHHFLRADYGTTQLGAQGTAAPLKHVVFWITETIADSLLVGFLAFVVGAARVLAPGEKEGRSFGWWMLLSAWLLAGPIFVMLFNRPPEGLTYEIVKRFHVLPVIVGAPFVAIGAERFLELEISRELRLGIVMAVVGLLIAAGWLRTNRVYDSTIEDYVENTLDSVPEGAVVIGQGDHRYFGFQYVQAVRGTRPDVVFIEPIVLGLDWYVDRMRRKLELELPYATERSEGGRRVELRQVLDLLLEESDREVFVTGDFAEEILEEYRMEPWGAGWRLLRADEREVEALVIARRNAELYDDFEHRSDAPRYVENRWGWSLWNTYTRVWRDIRERCGGDARCVEVADAYLGRYPDL